ncbi:MAG: hypothetical protein OEM97_07960 [Acidimicrobiia bacterium]|nr:hypothetical protein [Acidimicrobiia bacterium]
MTLGTASAREQARRWAIVVDSDPQMLSYLARGLMFFQPSYRVASAADREHLVEWMAAQAYQVAVLGCLGGSRRDADAAALLGPIPALVTLSCPHRDPGLTRPPRLSELLTAVRASTGRTDITIDLTAVTEVSV